MRIRRVSLVAITVVGLLGTWVVGAAASSVTVVQSDFKFTPSTLTVTKGSTLLVHNSTALTQHNFSVTGHGIDVTTNPGQTRSVAVDLPPGTYPFICRFHVSLGMRGTLVVLSSVSPGAPAPVGAPQTGAGGTASIPFPFMMVGLGCVLIVAGVTSLARRRLLSRR